MIRVKFSWCLWIFVLSFYFIPTLYAEEVEVKQIRKKTQEHYTTDAGYDHLQGNAEVHYEDKEGRWKMNSAVEDFHYQDKTTFDSGNLMYAETIGQTEIERLIITPNGKFFELRASQKLLPHNNGAWKQAQDFFNNGRSEYSQGDLKSSLRNFKEGLEVISNSNDSSLALSDLAMEMYFQTLILNETLGMERLKNGNIDEDTAQYFIKTIGMVLLLDNDQQLKQQIDNSLPPEKKLSGFLANSYYNLGMIYSALGYKDLKGRCVDKLHLLGRHDWAEEVKAAQ